MTTVISESKYFLALTHHYVLGDRVQHNLFKHVFHQQETGEVLEDELFKARQFLVRKGTEKKFIKLLAFNANISVNNKYSCLATPACVFRER